MPSATSSGPGIRRSNRSTKIITTPTAIADNKTQEFPLPSPSPSQIRNYFIPNTFRGEFRPYLYTRLEDGTNSRNDKPVPGKDELDRCHQTMRLGLGSPINNLKASHLVCSKKDKKIPHVDMNLKIIIPGYKLAQQCQQMSRGKNNGGGGDSCGLTSKMSRMKLYESPPPSSKSKCKGSGDRVEDKNKSKESIFDVGFRLLDKKVNLLTLGHEVTFNLGRGETLTLQRNKEEDNLDREKAIAEEEEMLGIKLKSKLKLNKKLLKESKSYSSNGNGSLKEEEKTIEIISVTITEENEMKAMPNLCKHFRGILGWLMSLHIKWKYIEERIKLWPDKLPLVSVQDVADLLKISEEDVMNFRIIPDIKHIFNHARSNLCHMNFPNIAKFMALSELQQENRNAAARYVSECCAMFLQSDIVDKHLNYIRRNEELGIDSSPRGDSEIFKSSLFLMQVRETLEFSKKFFGPKGDVEFVKAISQFDPDWNIIQLTTTYDHVNRFTNELIGKRPVPDLILSAFCYVPGQKLRSQFTVFCPEPRVDPGSFMRYGLMEEFQQVLDRNLAISDETMIISRKKYWEERARHNTSLEGIMAAMEEWLNPWIFLLPGRIKDQTIQTKIEKEILSHPIMKGSNDSQKLLISRLAENFNVIPTTMQIVLNTLVSLILKVDEEKASKLVNKMTELALNIALDVPRHSTILILDQEIDILPWDWLPIFRTTDVTRMPSLNLINSSSNIASSLKEDYPVSVDPEKCTFILNPDGTLPNVQQRLESYFKERNEWIPIVARSPTLQEMQDALEQQDILLYCGHGAGSHYYPEYAVQKLVCRAVPLLMGCSSAQSHYTGPKLYGNSVVNTYFIAGCPSVVGFLWEVTDTECDRITVDLVERWLPHVSAKPPKMPFFDKDGTRNREESLPTAVRKSRIAATQFLTKCSIVCYGLPVSTIK